jgi:hypothetical protein
MVVGEFFKMMHIRPGEVVVDDDKVGSKVGYLMSLRIRSGESL